MSIFSLFGKKDQQQTHSADKDSARPKHDAAGPHAPDAGMARMRADGGKNGTPANSRPTPKRNAKAAHATALKIDEIESQMTSEFVKSTAAAVMEKPRDTSAAIEVDLDFTKAAPEITPEAMGTTTGFLLDGQTAVNDVTTPTVEAAAVIEEAAIMFANRQTELVEQMLKAAIAEDKLGDAAMQPWWMLFDLYQIGDRQQEFENLSIEFASKFETSPPTWLPPTQLDAQPQAKSSGGIPMVAFSGKLHAGSIKLLERVRNLAANHRALRLEFVRVTEVDPVGCGLLLSVLKKLQKSGHELVLVGAPELANKIRAILEVGRRAETEVPWLLLLDILQLLNREQDFEEVSMDYCVTFEVSPPAFIAPKNKVTTAATEQQPAAQADATDAFVMPAVIEGCADKLILGMTCHSDQHDPAIIDCSCLVRVDFNAAGQLLSGLEPICGRGKIIEFHNVNHLVAALFGAIGLKDIARVLPRRN